MKTKSLLGLTAGVALALSSVGCGSEAGAPAASATSPAGSPPADVSAAAIVPGADLVARIDVAAIRSTPACRDAAEGGAAAGISEEDEEGAEKDDMDFEAFQRVSGLTPEDVLGVVIAADMDTVDLDAEDANARFASAGGVVAIHLARRLTPDTLAKALEAANAGKNDREVRRIEVAGHPAVQVARVETADASPDDEEDGPEPPPDLFAASGAGEGTVFLAPNQASLAGALQRADAKAFEKIPAPLESVRGSLPEGAQVKLAFLAPEKLRTGIQDQLAEAKQEPEAAMWAGMVTPFEKLQSIGLGVECGEEMRVGIGADLGSAESASQAAALLNGMVLPMAKGGMAQKLGKIPAEIDDRVSAAAKGSTLSLNVRLTKDEIAGLRKPSEEDEAGADEDEPSEP